MNKDQIPCRCHHNGPTACVTQVPIFNHLEKTYLDEIMTMTRSISFNKGEHIYHAGDEADSLYIVNKGQIRIYRLAESGKEQLVRILNSGDYTGELALFKQSLHESYAEAIVATNICVIKRDDLQELLLKYPTIAMKLLSEFSNRLEQSKKQTTRFSTETVEKRIALFLAESIDPDEDTDELTLPMSKKVLASYLGTTPETISRKLAELEEKGLIKQKPHKRIEVLDLDALLLI
ncbi:Crp/Fnr family transcriptional regulator [Ornithinibacillus californiensis]|uniref:Crp/Fnr family transcriptional regulator n=1 Tax=Ornithinibacillus californiensis TaxID=161536 RepID=UPI00064DE321|nr:Crp/Fnr family transcriptional regulator [Ornithinibacillus californiensis]